MLRVHGITGLHNDNIAFLIGSATVNNVITLIIYYLLHSVDIFVHIVQHTGNGSDMGHDPSLHLLHAAGDAHGFVQKDEAATHGNIGRADIAAIAVNRGGIPAIV